MGCVTRWQIMLGVHSTPSPTTKERWGVSVSSGWRERDHKSNHRSEILLLTVQSTAAAGTFFLPLFSFGQINFRKWSFVSLSIFCLPISLKKVHVAISSALSFPSIHRSIGRARLGNLGLCFLLEKPLSNGHFLILLWFGFASKLGDY